MKKKEIIEIINANIKYIDNIHFAKYEGIIHDIHYSRPFYLSEKEELKEWINILKKEIDEGVLEYKDAEEAINNFKEKCNHQVRLYYRHVFGSYTTCVFCNKTFDGNNCITGSSYDDKNRNKYQVSLIGKDTDEDDGYIDGYSKKEVYNIILDIIKDKKDAEEIDLVQEFKKLNLDKCSINEDTIKEEYNILIIGGSNILNIGNNAKIKREYNLNSIKLALALSDDLDINVDLIDSKDNIETYEIKEKLPYPDNFRYRSYDAISDLENILVERKNIPYNLIIDFTDLYNYEIKDNKINQTKYNIDLKDIFKDSIIMKIDKVNCLNERELLEHIKKELIKYNYYYANYSLNTNRYYYLYNDIFNRERLISEDLDGVYKKVKKLSLE